MPAMGEEKTGPSTKFSESSEGRSKEDAGGKHSRKRNLMRSSGAQRLGRRAELTASTPSPSRGARRSRRRCTSWSRRWWSGESPTIGKMRTTDSEGRTILIFKGGDRKDPAYYRPIHHLSAITKMVTLAIHKRMRRWLFESVETSLLELSSE